MLGGWGRQGWDRKESVFLRTVGIFEGSHIGIEMDSSAEGGVKVIKEPIEKCGMV
jgi:hypothetical protein